MASNIYFEARGEPLKGRMAVGFVTMNRVKKSRYPDSVCEVVFQKARNVCQFSWVCEKRLLSIREEVYNDIRKLAKTIYYGKVKDFTRGAMYFHRVDIAPKWSYSKKISLVIGNHIFYF